MEKTVRRRYEELCALCPEGAQAQEIEQVLMDAGLDVIDSSEELPDYLTTPEHFYTFRDHVQQGENAQQEIISVNSDGSLTYQLFVQQDGTPLLYSIHGADYEAREIKDWEVSEHGNFYYRIYPEWDKHCIAYAFIRLEKPDRQLWELFHKYVEAGSYVAANVFLTDWTEEDFGALSFNDVFEYLYRYRTGKPCDLSAFRYQKEEDRYLVPAEIFEDAVLPFFAIDRDFLRERAGYDEPLDSYPWQDVETQDFVFVGYTVIEPEVRAFRENGDGTLTLTVEALAPDRKTDCIFAHELTVRPLDTGGFQFVGNRVIFQTDYGLPYCEPRLTWDTRR